MTRILLLGAGGMLARALLAQRPPGVDIIAHTRAQLDITQACSVGTEIARVRPAVIVNAAAYTRVDQAEGEPEQALAVNATAPGLIGRVAREIGALVVHFGTDYIFDGRSQRPYREDDVPAPLSVYGQSKLRGEEALQESGARFLIVRSQWLFGIAGSCFPRTMWHRARKAMPTRAVNDQVGRPTYSVDLAQAMWTLLLDGRGQPRNDISGVVHVANGGIATWYDVARRIFAAAGVADRLTACTTAGYPTPARRPAWSVLDTRRYEALPGTVPLPPWEQAIDRFLHELRSRGAV